MFMDMILENSVIELLFELLFNSDLLLVFLGWVWVYFLYGVFFNVFIIIFIVNEKLVRDKLVIKFIVIFVSL